MVMSPEIMGRGKTRGGELKRGFICLKNVGQGEATLGGASMVSRRGALSHNVRYACM